MLDPNGSDIRADHEGRPRIASPDEQRIFQSFLTMLANLDFDYERERERIRASTRDPNLRELVLRKLAERHRERRDPYIRYLKLLQAKMMPTPSGERSRGWCSRDDEPNVRSPNAPEPCDGEGYGKPEYGLTGTGHESRWRVSQPGCHGWSHNVVVHDDGVPAGGGAVRLGRLAKR